MDENMGMVVEHPVCKVTSHGKLQRVITIPRPFWESYPLGSHVKLIPMKLVPGGENVISTERSRSVESPVPTAGKGKKEEI